MKKLSLNRLDPRENKSARIVLLTLLLTVGVVTPVFAQEGTGVAIIDNILDFIDDYKLAIAILGVAIIAMSLLIKPILPDLWNNHRSSIVYMVIGGILLTMLPTIAALIVGS